MDFKSRFDVGDSLGKDELGEVFRASDVKSGHGVAVKAFDKWLLETADGRDAYASTLTKLRTAGLRRTPPIADFHLDSDAGWLATALVDGSTLRALLDEGTLSPDEATAIASGILDALSELNEAGLTHGSLNPRKVLLTDGPTAQSVVITDPGQYQLYAVDNPLKQSRSNPDRFVGLPAYFSPEQANGKKPNAQSDVYVVGLILYEMLTGKTPFASNSKATTLKRQVYEKALPPRMAKPGLKITKDLEKILFTALDKKADKRFENAAAFRNALSSVRGDADPAAEKGADPLAAVLAMFSDPATPNDDSAGVANVSSEQSVVVVPDVDSPSIIIAPDPADSDADAQAIEESTTSDEAKSAATDNDDSAKDGGANDRESAKPPTADTGQGDDSDEEDSDEEESGDQDSSNKSQSRKSKRKKSRKKGRNKGASTSQSTATATASKVDAEPERLADSPSIIVDEGFAGEGERAVERERKESGAQKAVPAKASSARSSMELRALDEGVVEMNTSDPEEVDDWFAIGDKDAELMVERSGRNVEVVDRFDNSFDRWVKIGIPVALVAIVAIVLVVSNSSGNEDEAEDGASTEQAATSDDGQGNAGTNEPGDDSNAANATGNNADPTPDNGTDAGTDTGSAVAATDASADSIEEATGAAVDPGTGLEPAGTGQAPPEATGANVPEGTGDTPVVAVVEEPVVEEPIVEEPIVEEPIVEEPVVEEPVVEEPVVEEPVVEEPVVDDSAEAEAQSRVLAEQGADAIDSGNISEGTSLLEQAIELDSGNHRAYAALGDMYFDQRDYGEAADHHERATRISSRNEDYFNALGMDYFRLGDLEEALEAFERAVELGSSEAGRYVGIVRERLAE